VSRQRQVGYRWHLRQRMATRGMFSTTDLAPLLAERGVELSAAQVYRLVTQTPERLNLHTLAALCDILDCTPADLIEPVVEAGRTRRAATQGRRSSAGEPGPARLRPTRARIIDSAEPKKQR
jgi:DNA-binding Xre family transcriptional regulator